ncbi:E3 UFM1-protein ligase 1 [Latimeria chalumnae]|uniref:E3 UFM1-protein ligase 1 n=1 Tax=Latimeria chalumnae TaxID=7897 RepID=H3AM68_LATCH|nr:PREDICTED: E3 UFM1-protein ligase 1 [Latimeria chalumnae]|eukprot:XP_006004935.1 PREDICTED: E3 UFM1-protein ligase 1 [Latimeria chalumnae]
MAADWEEIRRLAADFQRAQFTETVQRLSERNCIEIVSKLLTDKQLDVVHTLDGKEYITPAQISREIRDELYVHGGRINIVDLYQIINVDLAHVESKANDIAKSDRNIQLVLGQLIDENYLDQLAEEVNDRLQEAGQVTVAELCKTYDLPGDFLTEALSQRLGGIIQGQMDQYDRGVLFTEAFISRHRARIRGLFSAITRPTSVSNLITQYGFQEHLLYSVLEELVNAGRLKGIVVGGRQDKAVFIPDIYSKTQNSWVDSFFKQNGYLEHDALTRLCIPDPVSYIKKRYKSAQLLFLKAACVGQSIVDQVEASVEEAISSGTWVDIQPILPTSFSVEDVGFLLHQVMRTLNKQSAARIFNDTIVVSEKFISNCTSLFEQLMYQKAEKEVKNNPVFVITEEDLRHASAVTESAAPTRKDKREERRKKAAEGSGSVRGGGGGNAREIKIRKPKKKGKREEDSDEEAPPATNKNKQQEIPFMSQEQIEDVLQKHVPDCPEELLANLAGHLIRPLTKSYQEVVRSVFMSSTNSTGSSRKKTVKDLQEEVSNLYNNIRLFEKGIKLFADDTQATFAKHLLKTICTDITNLIFNFLASDLMMGVENYSALTYEFRIKVLAKLPEETKGPLTKLHNSLNGKSLEEFLTVLDSVAEVCDIMLKKGDKKKERQVVFQHRQALIEQLKVTEDPALVLHLTSIVLFQLSTHCMLHAPGRCVPQIITFLHAKIPEDQYNLLVKYQGLVVKQLIEQNKKSDQGTGDLAECQSDTVEINAVRKEMQELTSSIKDLVLRSRKSSTNED